jgi:beta-lactamase class A
MKQTLASACVVLAAATLAAQPADELRQKFDRRLHDIASRVDGVVGYDVVDVTSGDRFAHLEGTVFPTASAIKLAIVYELFAQAAEGRVRLDDSMALDRSKAVGGTGVLVHMGTPTLSIRDYATLMVTLSDNTATNVLIDKLGMADIARRMTSLGLSSTKLRRHMMDTAAARRGEENVATPAELVSLLKALNTVPDAVALLKLPKENRLRRGLPDGVESADKSGELDGVRVDAGIVFAKNRPYIFAVMATFLKDETEGERAITEMSRVAYEYFERLGSSGVGGRRIGK